MNVATARRHNNPMPIEESVPWMLQYNTELAFDVDLSARGASSDRQDVYFPYVNMTVLKSLPPAADTRTPGLSNSR